MTILVTGGAGFIGSHTVVELLTAGFDVVIVDNLSNASEGSIKTIEAITHKSVTFYPIDICDEAALEKVFEQHNIEVVIHFAALKAVGVSTQKPLEYYQNNVGGSITLFEVMQRFNVRSCVFSSSAAVYGVPLQLPVTENEPLKPSNPYGMTKLMVEAILQDLATYSGWSVINLRYFNPIGAHESGLIGENPQGVPNNLLPYLCQVAVKKLPSLKVYGKDYSTPDGTGVRDYLHVVDLARAHLVALKKVKQVSGMKTYNLGTGQGYSVMEIIETFKKVNHVDVPYEIVARRPGDIASCYADSSLALQELGWKTEFGLEDMLRDAWRWAQQAYLYQ